MSLWCGCRALIENEKDCIRRKDVEEDDDLDGEGSIGERTERCAQILVDAIEEKRLSSSSVAVEEEWSSVG